VPATPLSSHTAVFAVPIISSRGIVGSFAGVTAHVLETVLSPASSELDQSREKG
jgi:hypothetical protein